MDWILAVIGGHTVQNKLQRESLELETDLTVMVRARSDSIFENGDDMEPIVETVKIMQRISGLNLTSSFYLPLERSQVEALPMGHILNWESLPACIPPVLSGMEISGLDLAIGDIHEPTLQGIESNDIGELAKSGIRIGMARFEDEVTSMIPALVQTEVRDALNKVLMSSRCTVERRLVEGEEEFEPVHGEELYINLICALVCVCTAALAAGLTMGLLSLDELMLLIKERAGATEKERKAAARLLPIVRQHHLLLVSLLLMNAMANEALPLFLDKIVPGYIAVILSVTVSAW